MHFATLGAIYIGHSSTRHVHNLPIAHLRTSVAKDVWYYLYRLQSSMGYACNSRESTLVAEYGLRTPREAIAKGSLILP